RAPRTGRGRSGPAARGRGTRHSAALPGPALRAGRPAARTASGPRARTAPRSTRPTAPFVPPSCPRTVRRPAAPCLTRETCVVMTDYSVLTPCVPRRLGQAMPFAGRVNGTPALRLWRGQSMILEPHPACVGAAGAGFRVAVGFGVTVMPLRHPFEAANQARSVALATGHPVI